MTKSILLPVDLNHDSSWGKALPQAVDLARASGAKLHVLTVIPDYGSSMVGSYFPKDFSEKALDGTRTALDKFMTDHIPDDLHATSHAMHGSIYKSILSTAKSEGCDLIVMASHRSEMKDYLLGPNAARVVRHAPQSVFVVRED